MQNASCMSIITWGSDMRKDFRNSLNVMSENWFSATAGRGNAGESTLGWATWNKTLMQTQRGLTCERVVSFIVFVNPLLVLCEYLQSLVVLLQVVPFVVLYMEEGFWFRHLFLSLMRDSIVQRALEPHCYYDFLTRQLPHNNILSAIFCLCHGAITYLCHPWLEVKLVCK